MIIPRVLININFDDFFSGLCAEYKHMYMFTPYD